MHTIQSTHNNSVLILWIAVVLALATALFYVLMAYNILGVGDPGIGERPGNIIFVAAACYLAGGLLMPLRKRWLLLFGAIINALVILFFFSIYRDRSAVMISPGGLLSKVAQILLEAALIYIIATNWRRIATR